MASANRPSRFSPRTSSLFPPQQDNMPTQQNRMPTQQNMPPLPRTNMDSNGWVEPPLRPPVPSFMDYKGVERQGVLEQMVALGTPPTARVKARSKGDPIRRTVQARNLEDMVVDDARATPDFTTNTTASASAAARTPELSEREFTRGAGASETGMNQLGIHSHLHSHSLFQPPSSTHSHSTTSLHNTPAARVSNSFASPTSSGEPSEKAFSIAALKAIQDDRPDVEQRLLDIRAAALRDPELATLLSFAMTNNSLDERGSAVRRKLKQLKISLRSPTSSPQNAMARGLPLSHTNSVSRSPSQTHVRTIGQTNNRDAPLLPNFSHLTAATSPSPQRTPAKKLSLKPSSTVNGIVGKEYMASSPNMRHQPPPRAVSRRSSSSSLSSVDEGLAAGPPPLSNIAQSEAKMEFTQNVSLLDEDDAEVEVQKENMRKTFPTVESIESNERPALTPKAPSSHETSQSKPVTKLILKGPTQSLRNGIEQVNRASLGPNMVAGPAAALKRKATTPPPTPTNLGRPPKKSRTAAKIKMSPQKNHQPAVVAGIARSQNRRHTSLGLDDQRSELSDNIDSCFTCGGYGYLLCCDGCDRAFHFSCLDPPLDEKSVLDGPWECHACKADKQPEEPANTGLFAELQDRIVTKNPTSFILPQFVRDYFIGVETGANGEYVEVVDEKTNNSKGRMGYDEAPDYRRLKDGNGNVILCYYCHESSLGQRDIIGCDYCNNHWHLDCLNPPLANPPSRGQNGKSRKWRCPLHTEQDLQTIDSLEKGGVHCVGMGRTHKVRRPKNAKLVVPTLRRGFKNNGLIEIEEEESNVENSEMDEETPDGVVWKLPAEGVKLDFIDRVKSKRQSDAQAMQARLYEIQQRSAQLILSNGEQLWQALLRRGLKEQITALNLVQLATNELTIDIGSSQLGNFILTVLAETPANVIELLDRETASATTNADGSTARPPSSPAPLTEKQRNLAKMLVKLLQARLGPDGEDDANEGAETHDGMVNRN